MVKDDWFRRTSWTKEDQDEFFARNARARSADAKEQNARIQAGTLFSTGKPGLIEAALALLERAISDFPETIGHAAALELAGSCCEALSRTDEALDYYRAAIERERAYPNVQTNACFHFARMAVEHGRDDLYDEALAGMEAYGPPVFPLQNYWREGLLAVRAKRDGAPQKAGEHARAALDVAEVRDTGLGAGKGELGTLGPQHARTRFHRVVEKLADE
jgi:tetratricopeptide (TPR) repeat protein